MALSAYDNSSLVISTLDRKIHIYPEVEGAAITVSRNHILESALLPVAFAHSSQLIIMGDYEGHVCLWDRDTGECLQTLRHGCAGIIQALSVSNIPDYILSKFSSSPLEVSLGHSNNPCIATAGNMDDGKTSIIVIWYHDAKGLTTTLSELK